MKHHLLLPLSLFLTFGCASNEIPFQKSSNGVGYTIEHSKRPDYFIVRLQLPLKSEEASFKRYAARAVGEECLARGFTFFDLTDPKDNSVEGFCFKENKRKALGISFDKKYLENSPPSFVVENLNSKSRTNLLVGDKVNKIAGQEVGSVSRIKSLIFLSNNQQVSEVDITLERNGKNLSVKEPIADLLGGAFGKDDLDALRKQYL